MENNAESLVKAFLVQLNELRANDTNRLTTGSCSTMERYHFHVGRIKAFNECEKIISELLKQSE